jgi:hypothetical protein
MSDQGWQHYQYGDLHGRFVALVRRDSFNRAERFDFNLRRWVAVPGESLSRALENGDVLVDRILAPCAASITGDRLED